MFLFVTHQQDMYKTDRSCTCYFLHLTIQGMTIHNSTILPLPIGTFHDFLTQIDYLLVVLTLMENICVRIKELAKVILPIIAS